MPLLVCKAMADRMPDESDPYVLIANPACVCPTAMAAMACMTGHMLECHYPMTCSQAECEHWKRAAEEGAQLIDEPELP